MSEKETKAIELKYNGDKYENIAKAVGVALPTVKDWFSAGGKLKNYYIAYEAEQSELSKKEAQRVVTKNVHKAAKALVDLLGSENENIKFRAAEAILDRELGKTGQQIESKESVASLFMLADGIRKAPDDVKTRLVERLRELNNQTTH